MPPGKTQRKVRPSTASGLLQSHEVTNLFDDLRPATAPGKNLFGLEPTFVTSRHHVPGSVMPSQAMGRQVHGGLPMSDLKGLQGRRATLGGLEDVADREKPMRPSTAISAGQQIKLEDRITLEHLNKMRRAFEEADSDGNGTLDLEEFKDVIKNLFNFRFKSDDQVTSLFMKIDSSSDGEINWDEFCTFMQLEYAEKEDSYLRSKETSFCLPAIIENSSQREQVIRLCHTSDNNFLVISQDGMVSFWSQNLEFKRMKHIESSTKKTKWITDFVLMPHYNKFIISTGDREIQFFELSTFEPYCQISGLETTPLRIDYCSTGQDECILLYGDNQGCVSILMLHSTGETLRTWKKMPKVEGIASVNIDSVVNSENAKFVRWKVHDDWVSQLKYYDSLRAVISCSNHHNTALVIGQTTGSTHIESQLREGNASNPTRKVQASSLKDMQPRRRLASDQTVFRIYKGVKTFDFCKEKNVIATGGMDRLVRMWNPYVPSKPTGILRGHTAPIFHLFISAEDDRIFSISTDKTVKVWDLHDHTCLLTVRPKAHKIRGDLSAIHYNPISKGLAVATSDLIALLPLRNKHVARDMTTTHKEAVNCVRYNKSFKHVITASEGSVIKVWDVETGNHVFEFSQAHGDTAITAMSFDSTERRLITGGRDGRLRIWNYNNGHCLRTLEKESDIDEVSDLCYIVMNKNRYIMSVGWDRRINLFSDDSDDYHHIQHPYAYWTDDVHNGHKEDILSVASCPPNLLATSSYDGEIIIWNQISGHIFCHIFSPLVAEDGRNGDHLASLDGRNAITKILFLKERASKKDAATLVASGPQGHVHFWNIYSGGTLYAAFKSSQHGVSTMAVACGDTKLVTADSAGFVTIWDIEGYCLTKEDNVGPPPKLASWRAHVQSVTCIEPVEAFDVLLTASQDTTVRMWTWEGHFVGTFGQPKMWDVRLPASYQHQMGPYDVLVDPNSLPAHPVFAEGDSEHELGHRDSKTREDQGDDPAPPPTVVQPRNVVIVNDAQIAEELKKKPTANDMGKRLRHEKLKRTPKDVGGPNAYQTLTCFELETTPPLPSHPGNSSIDDPFDI